MTCLGLPWHALTRGGIFCRLPLGFLAFVGFFLVLWLLVLFEFVVFAGSVFDVCIFLFFFGCCCFCGLCGFCDLKAFDMFYTFLAVVHGSFLISDFVASWAYSF